MNSFLSLILTLILAQNALAIRFTGNQDPARIQSNFEYRLTELPLKNATGTTPWSGGYWPDREGGINIRWNQRYPVGFDTPSPALAEIRQMTPTALALLSPSEKFDIYRGRYDYPLKNEVAERISSSHPEWYGVCDGWAIASTQYAEPEAVRTVNRDGIEILFGSSDVKALMSYAAVYRFNVQTAQVGAGCKTGAECEGLNAGAFHILLTNLIGLQDRSFMIDRSVSPEVWNQPVFAYDLKVIGSVRPDEGSSGVRIQGNVFYTEVQDHPSWNSVLGTSQQKHVVWRVDYNLDLDEAGRVIGGRFNRKSGKPDFAWIPINRLDFTGDFSLLHNLVSSK